MGIVDWSLKKELIRLALRQPRKNDVLEVLYDWDDESRRPPFTFESLLDHFANRWGKPNFPKPVKSKYREFFQTLSIFLETKESVSGDALIHLPAIEFVLALGEKYRSVLRASTKDSTTHIDPTLRDLVERAITEADLIDQRRETVYSHQYKSDTQFENASLSGVPHTPFWLPTSPSSKRLLQHGLDDKFIDQSLYYQTPESVNLWFAITNAETYSGFDQCQVSLRKFVHNTLWKDYSRNGSFLGTVMLGGGGSPSKDKILLKSISASEPTSTRQNKLRHTLLDTSIYMLKSSVWQLGGAREALGIQDKVDIVPLEADMLNLKPHREFIRPYSGSIAWFLTGGTIGNVDETHLFSSVTSAAHENDLLIIGAGCLNEHITVEYVQGLVKEYEQEAVKAFVTVPLRAVWSSLDLSGRAKDALDKITVIPFLPKNNPHSAVDGSVTVIATIQIQGLGDVILFKSTRYEEEALVALARQHRWKHLTSIDGLDKTFKQVVFQYSPEI